MKERFIKLGQVIWKKLRHFFHRKRLIRYSVYLGILIILWLCRYPILRGFGNYLITEDPIEQADAIYILGGASNERSAEAYRLVKKGYAEKVICLGGHVTEWPHFIDTNLTEAQTTGTLLKEKGMDKRNIFYINNGFSTRDEAELILSNAKNRFKKIIILSSKFHLRRVRRTFRKAFGDSPVKLIFRGAPAKDYDENEWWKYEKGLLMVNNEYIKMFYYWWTE